MIGFATRSSLVIDLFTSGQNVLKNEISTVEKKSIQLLYEAQKETPSAHFLCHSGLGLDEESNYLNERAAYICSRHSSGFARNVNPYLISTWAIAQTQRVLPATGDNSISAGDLFLRLLANKDDAERLHIMNLTASDNHLPIDTWPEIAWLEDLDLNHFSIKRIEFPDNISLATWLLKND
jgi:hypothetical protein